MLVWHPARLIKEGGCADLAMDTMHLKYVMRCHCSSTMTKDHILITFYGTKSVCGGGGGQIILGGGVEF